MIYSELKSFGYPVINPFGDDFLDHKFTSNIEELDHDEENGELTAKIYHTVPNFIKTLAKNKKVKFLTVLRCNFTSFETHRIYYESDQTLSFSSKDCSGKISIDSYIVCNEVLKIGKEIEKKYINKFYHSLDKSYKKNTLIGFSEPLQFSLEPELNAPISSIFEIIDKKSVEKGCLVYDFSENLIRIYLHKDDLGIYKRIENTFGNERKAHLDILTSVVLIPALSAALFAYSKEHDSNSLTWKSTLYAKLKELNMDPDHIQPEDINTLANKIIYSDKDKSLTQLLNSIKFLGAEYDE